MKELKERRPDVYKFLTEKLGCEFLGIKEVPISEIKFDEDLYPREEIDEETVEEFKTQIENGAEFPPIVLTEDLVELDGRRRTLAHQKTGKQKIKAEIWKVPKPEYKYLIAQLINGGTDTPLKPSEKRKAILKDWDAGIRDIELIAKAVHTTEKYVKYILSTSGRLKDLKTKMKERALELANQGKTQNEIVKILEKEFGEKVIQSTISRWLSEKRKKINLLTPDGSPTPEGLRLWSEYVEQSDTEKEDLFNPERFLEFLKKKGLEAQKVEKIGKVYFNGTPEQAFMMVVEQAIKQRIQNAVNNGLDERDIKLLISKGKTGIFQYMSSTAKAKLAGLLSDYIQEQIQKREERQKEEELIIETAKEILQNPEFIFSSWTNLGKEVLKRLEEKGNYLRHKYHEGTISEILQKHSNTLLDIYKSIPEISENELKEIIEDYDLEEFESLEQFRETIRANVIQEGKRPAGVDILATKVWNEYYSQKIKQQEKAPPSPPPATDLEDSTVESSLSNETEEELSEEEYIKKLEESWERAHSQTEEEKAKTGPKGPHKHTKQDEERPQTPEQILNDYTTHVQTYTLAILSTFGRKKAIEVLEQLLEDLTSLSFNKLRMKWNRAYANARRDLGIETYEYWREEV